ncbi:MAG TPA: SAM-dependent methyltransferase [Nevskiales bacterium]|nr:SAM-dependent methyltransferase [Nevskiales bacterium]
MTAKFLTPPAGLPAPEPAAAAHAVRLAELIRAEIEAGGGAISFRRYMELALYAPALGYYSAGARKFGPGGDFITAPELSPLFSRCLARQCAEVLTQTGGDILELGAGSGVMAADMLAELEALAALPERYRILELSGELRQRQRETLAARVPHLLSRVTWLERLPEPGFRGVMVGNEVLDALPVERFQLTAAGPRPLGVTWDGAGFTWTELAEDPALTAALQASEAALGWRLPPGYASELCTALGPWLTALAQALEAGVLLFIDYGYPRREYYHPERDRGTLLCHYRHHAHDDPLVLPGLQDITASVDFSAVAEAGLAAGLELAGYTSQAYFLFGCGLERLLAEVDPADTRRYLALTGQVKRLTLPGEMGERFQAIALARGLERPLSAFVLFDQRRRL